MNKFLLPIFLIGTILTQVIVFRTGATLKTPQTPIGILNLEFAYNTIKTDAVLKSWSPANGVDNIKVAKINTYYDFLFLFFYAGFLFLACKKIAVLNKNKTGLWIATGALLAGLLDVLENFGMLYTLSGHSNNTITFLTAIFAGIKFLFVIIAIFYLLFGLLWRMVRKH